MGAYANGNLGDMYQADAIARLVRSINSEVDVVSISPSKRQSRYPASSHERGPAAFNPSYINEFDLLLVGGGGLLAAPHAPLHDPEWVAQITIPVCALSLGAVEQTAEQSRAFVQRCQLFAVRDEFSHAAVRAIRPDAQIIMDPILLDSVGKDPRNTRASRGIAWVPGKLVSGTEELWLSSYKRLFHPDRDWLASFNPVTDQNSGFDSVFSDVNYLDNIDHFMDAAQSRRLVVSERYHACIYALGAGIPALGVCLRSKSVTSKIEELFRRIGCPDTIIRQPFSESRKDLVERAASINLKFVREFLLNERQNILAFLRECLDVAAKSGR